MTQAEAILAYLKAGATLTPLEALDRFGCLRLGARCFDLRRKGEPVRSRFVATPSGKHVAQYYYEP